MESLNHYLFIDIETACCVPSYEQLGDGLQREWDAKAKRLAGTNAEEVDGALLFWNKAGIFAEFGKIVCISIGSLRQKGADWKLYLKSFAGNDEKLLLNAFCSTVSKFDRQDRKLTFCGHNIKEFDLPYISRRMIINGMGLPDCLLLHGKKPWEVPHVDTMELWSFGDRKNYTKLSLLAEVLGIPTPKDDISGEDVSRVYWHEHDLQRIATYCQKDVETTARVFMRLMCYDEVPFSSEILDEPQNVLTQNA
jgi:hypothetical protein